MWKWVNGVDQYSKQVWLEDRPGRAKLSQKWCFYIITFLTIMKINIVPLRLEVLYKLKINPGNVVFQMEYIYTF